MGRPNKIMRAPVGRFEALAVGFVMSGRTFRHVICHACAGTRSKPMRYRDAGNRRPSVPSVTRSHCANSSDSSDKSRSDEMESAQAENGKTAEQTQRMKAQ